MVKDITTLLFDLGLFNRVSLSPTDHPIGGLAPTGAAEVRARALLAVVADEGIRQMSTPTATPEEADTVLEWALPMLGISPAKAKRLAHAPLPPLEVPAG